MKKTTALVLVSFFLFTSYRPHTPSISKHFTIQAIAPGVWAAINNDEYGHAICNAGIIDLGDKTVIFDSFMNIDAAMDLKSAAIALTNKTATIIINSHFHNDHIRGNQVFVPEATIISTIWTRQQISISEPEEISWEKQNAANRLADAKEKFKIADGMAKKELPMWIGYFEGMVLSDPILITTLPDLTFSDSLWIHGKNRNIQLLECKNGHTGSDIILELPVEGIVFMGDLLFVNRHPWLGDGNYKSWLTHLQKMAEDKNYLIYVPGHGPVGGKKEMSLMINYLKDIHQLVKSGIENNLADSLITNSKIPDTYSSWWFGRFYKPNLSFLCNEIKKK